MSLSISMLYKITRKDKKVTLKREEDEDTSIREHITKIEEPLYNAKWERQNVILDISKLAILANLCDSLEWIADKIDAIGKPKSGITSVSRNVVPTPSENLAPSYRTLADRCLISLRAEYRMHCFYYLDNLKRSNYYLNEEALEPDYFINDLSKDLSINEEVMSSSLPTIKKRFLFDGLAQLISNILIRYTQKVGKVSMFGIKKLIRNLFALQQSLTNIIVSQENYFDRVRKYYELFFLTEDELLGHITSAVLSKQIPFNYDAYKAIFELKAVGKKVNEKYTMSLKQLVPN